MCVYGCEYKAVESSQQLVFQCFRQFSGGFGRFSPFSICPAVKGKLIGMSVGGLTVCRD